MDTKVRETSNGNFAVIPWKPFEVKGDKLLELLQGRVNRMKAYIVKKKCAAQPDICQPMKKCPEKAFKYDVNIPI